MSDAASRLVRNCLKLARACAGTSCRGWNSFKTPSKIIVQHLGIRAFMLTFIFESISALEPCQGFNNTDCARHNALIDFACLTEHNCLSRT